MNHQDVSHALLALRRDDDLNDTDPLGEWAYWSLAALWCQHRADEPTEFGYRVGRASMARSFFLGGLS